MNQNDVFTYLGIVVVIGFVLYTILRLANLQRNVVEGLINRDSKNTVESNILDTETDEIKKKLEKLNDTILIDKHREKYENLIIDLEEIMNLNLLQGTVQLGNIVNNEGNFASKELLQSFQLMNEMYKLRDNLNSTMEFLDSKKSTASKVGGLFS